MPNEQTSPSLIPTLNEIKLTIDKSNLEMEARLKQNITDALSDQNRTYMTEIISITKDVTSIREQVNRNTLSIKGFKGLVATTSSVTGVLGGLVGFFISQLMHIGGN